MAGAFGLWAVDGGDVFFQSGGDVTASAFSAVEVVAAFYVECLLYWFRFDAEFACEILGFLNAHGGSGSWVVVDSCESVFWVVVVDWSETSSHLSVAHFNSLQLCLARFFLVYFISETTHILN